MGMHKGVTKHCCFSVYGTTTLGAMRMTMKSKICPQGTHYVSGVNSVQEFSILH